MKRHHWIFSGAIHSYPKNYQEGELACISSAEGKILGWGFFNRRCSLAGRVVSFEDGDVFEALQHSLKKAIALRKNMLAACRLVNGEGDGLPGLIIDKYGPYLVVQVGALGMHMLLPFFVDQLKSMLAIEGIYEKSTGGSLKEEGMDPQERVLWGSVPDKVKIKEEGMEFWVDLKEGQKTGFFFDQREMRKMIRELAKAKRVLNGFCYTGGFTLAALKGGAISVDSVDVSSSAIQLCRENVALNGFDSEKMRFFEEDMFEFLSTHGSEYDLVILDPPAFAKKKKDIPSAIKGYKRLFEMAMRKMPANSLLLLSSCSYYISKDLFENMVLEVGLKIGRPMQIIGYHRHAFDHPINLFHPESDYLKSLLIAL